jgi:uncharacterized protein YaaW (UPF0174 family)
VLSQLGTQERLAWLDKHRPELADEVCAVGSHTFGRRRPYPEIVRDLAQKVGAEFSPADSVREVEVKIVKKVSQDTWKKLSPEERAKFQAEIEKLAAQHGKSALGPGLGFAALATAQLSGFGVYALAASLFGGLGLSFGFFTGLSTLISVAIGPLGWIGMGLVAIRKLGAPNHKKLLPVVVLIAIERQGGSESGWLRNERAEPFVPIVSVPTASQPPVPPNPDLAPELLADYDRISGVVCDRPYSALSPENQELIRNLHSESCQIDRPRSHSDTVAAVSAAGEDGATSTEGRNPSRSKAKVVIIRDGGGPSKPPEKRLQPLRRRIRKSFLHLDFTDATLEALSQMDEREQDPFWAKFGQMNIGQVDAKDKVEGTNPAIYEDEVGRDGRVYFRQTGADRYLIYLVGAKGSQKRDCRFLRRSHAA